MSGECVTVRVSSVYGKRDPTYALCYCLFINLCLLVPQHVSAYTYPIVRGVLLQICIRCALNGNYKTVKQLKVEHASCSVGMFHHTVTRYIWPNTRDILQHIPLGITCLRDTRPKVSNITPNQHKNFTEFFNIFNCITVV
jgi:hypothetical protein